MTFQETIKKWVEWTRTQLLPESQLPLTGGLEVDPPWLEDMWEFFDYSGSTKRAGMLQAFEQELAVGIGDIAVRFCALDYYYGLVRCESAFKEELVSEIRVAFTRDFEHLVRLVPLESCTTWRELRWEIVNACLARAWDLADRLFERASKLQVLEKPTIQALRGEFNFLISFIDEVIRDLGDFLHTVFGLKPVIEPHIWDRQLHIANEPYKALIGAAFYRTSLCAFRELPSLSADQVERLRYAISDLESALARAPGLFVGYRAMLAKCYFAVADYHNAARHYEIILTTNPSDLLYRSLAACQRLAGDPGGARKTLLECLEKFPNEKGIHLQIAELESQEGRPDKVTEEIRKEMAVDPEVDQDWRISALLALGETDDASDKMLARMKADKESYDFIRSVLSEYWEPFSGMTGNAQERWVLATRWLHLGMSDRTMRHLHMRAAAAEFAKAVEIMMLENVFARFRDHARKSPELNQMAHEGLESKELQEFCRFIVWKNAPLTLGKMLYVLAHWQEETDTIYRRFGLWLEQCHRDVADLQKELDIVNSFRRPEAHGGKAKKNPEEITALCKKVIEVIVLTGEDAGA